MFSINTEIADFIAWLDFVNQPLTQRPASRVMNERAIFEIGKLKGKRFT